MSDSWQAGSSQSDKHFVDSFNTTRAREKETARRADEGPRPLTRQLPPETPFPVDSLGPVLSGVVKAIDAKTQAPLPICANSVLAVSTLAVQGHADVVLPTGQRKPLSEFFITIAGSGERKSAADSLATEPIKEYERQLEAQYKADCENFKIIHAAWSKQRDQLLNDKNANRELSAKKQALAELGPEPEAPLLPIYLCGGPTIEGLYRLLREGQPSVGLFSDEGGAFVGGHAMSEDHRLKTAAGLSKLFDGEPLKRPRAGEGTYILRGKRLSLHLLVQPRVAVNIFNDENLRDQGVLSRMLAVHPVSAVGTRFWKDPEPEHFRGLSHFSGTIGAILRTPPRMADGERNVLAPRALTLSDEATRIWKGFSDFVERQSGPGGEYEPISWTREQAA